MRTPPVVAMGTAKVVLPPGSFLQATVAGEEALAALVEAALLHDVGKTQIPLDIVRKPGALDKRERGIIEAHTTMGAEILIQTDGLHAVIATPVIIGDYIYGICSYGQFRCLKASTGERMWETQAVTKERARWASGVIVRHGDRLFINNDRGELIIVKHNDQWLSAYGHNRARLVNEGQLVKAGQQIAEMGRSGAARDMLHFEIRYNGKPVDPQAYLPKR